MWHAVYSNQPFYVGQLEDIRVKIEKTYVENKETRVQRLLSQGPRAGRPTHSCITSSFRLLIKDRLNSLQFLLDTGSEVSVHSPTEANKRNGTSSDLTSSPLPQEQRESDFLLISNKNF
ncbi:hypothetical protein BLOT_012405 [Blomia tropicalis]|nr:hypothetical protein BLOT_012405 [Blomia tropicalis]